MKIVVKVGDVHGVPADVLISTANPLLNLSVSSPTLATGYGPMSISDFGSALAHVLNKYSLENLTLNLVVRRKDHAIELQEALF